MANIKWKVTLVRRNGMTGEHQIEATLSYENDATPFATVSCSFPPGTSVADVWVKLKAAADPLVASYLEQAEMEASLLGQSGTLTY